LKATEENNKYKQDFYNVAYNFPYN